MTPLVAGARHLGPAWLDKFGDQAGDQENVPGEIRTHGPQIRNLVPLVDHYISFQINQMDTEYFEAL